MLRAIFDLVVAAMNLVADIAIVKYWKSKDTEAGDDEDTMTQQELALFLETLAENVELKAQTGKEAADIIREKGTALRKP